MPLPMQLPLAAVGAHAHVHAASWKQHASNTVRYEGAQVHVWLCYWAYGIMGVLIDGLGILLDLEREGLATCLAISYVANIAQNPFG